MKTPKFIFTHIAVFAIGAAAAWIGQRPDGNRSAGDADDASPRRSSLRSGQSADSGLDSKSTLLRERRENAGRDGRTSSGTATARLAEINLIADPMDRQMALLELVSRLAPGEFAALADQHRATDHYGNAGDEFEIILRGWAKVDPLAALEYASKGPDSRENNSVILSTWAGTDSAAAERWALANHEGDGPNPYLTAVIRGIAAHDIGHATQLAESMPASRERARAMDAITRALFVQGAESAMAYPATIKDPGMRAGYVSMIADRLAGKDPEKAAAWLAAMPDAADQAGGARRVAQALSRQNVTEAAAWVGKLSPAARAEAARGVIVPMSSGDIAGTARWVSTLSGIPNYDRVVEEFVWSCDRRAPEQSAAWIQGVADEAQRTRLYHRMLGDWARRDAAAVKTWIANNDVPPSVANRFNR